MASLNPAQAHQAKALIGQVVRALVAENSLLRDDSTRIRRLISEAADTLRSRFREIDETIKCSACADELSRQQRAAYQNIISTLQFEDIVSQVMAHQIERSELSMTILLQIEEQLYSSEDNSDTSSILSTLSGQIESFISRISASESVKQQSLTVGEAELF